MIKYKQFCGTEGKGVVSQPRTLNTLFDKSAHFFSIKLILKETQDGCRNLLSYFSFCCTVSHFSDHTGSSY